MKITDLNLDGISSEYINILRENDPDNDNLYDFPYSLEIVMDFNNRIVNRKKYKK